MIINYVYDAWRQLTGTTYSDNTPAITNVYNALGQLLSTSDAAGTLVKTYNAFGELETETCENNAIAELRDDFGRSIGYVYSKSGTAQQTTSVCYDSASGKIASAGFLHGGNAKNFAYNYLAGTQIVVEMNYDSQGRRFEKKVMVAGTVLLHHRYIYRGFLQIACLDLTRAGTPALWFIFWDPTQSTATRPLAIQKNGTWFVYGHDLTKNVCEVFGSDGYIKTTYSYSPFGKVSSVGNFEQNFQWSSEFYDHELALVYYNYRHYSSSIGCWLSRDPIEEQGGANLYCFVENIPVKK